MSLVVAVAVADGIILAADSRTTTCDLQGQYRISTDYCEKLFEVAGYGVGTAGYAVLNGKTIANHVGEFAKTVPNPIAFDDFSMQLTTYFMNAYAEHIKAFPQGRAQPDAPVVEFLVAGYEGGQPRVDYILLYEPSPTNAAGYNTRVQIPPGAFSAAWLGMSETLQKLFFGYAPSLVGQLPAPVDLLFRQRAHNVPFAFYSLQDALNLAAFCVDVTIRWQRFSLSRNGPESANVGGFTEFAKVSPAGFAWIRRKQLEVLPQFSDVPDLGNPGSA